MRIGQFSRTSLDYGAVTDVAKPADNDYGSVIPNALQDPSLALTDAQKQDLTQRIQDLFNVYRGAREWYT
jgi:hypothetical protein